MPIPTSTRGVVAPKKKKLMEKREEMEVDLSQLSAYAVYNNLVPGVSVYEDTSESTHASRQKRNRKNKRKQAEALKKDENKITETATDSSNGFLQSKKIDKDATKKLDKKIVGEKNSVNGTAPKKSSQKIASDSATIASENLKDKPKNKRKRKSGDAQSSVGITSNSVGPKVTETDAGKQKAAEEPESEVASKKRKRKKKNKTKTSELTASMQEDASPTKLRKVDKAGIKTPYSDELVTFVPNPLAKKSMGKQEANKNEKSKAHSSTLKAPPQKSKNTPFDYSVLPDLSKAVPAPGIIGFATPDDRDDESAYYADDSSPPNVRTLLNSEPIEDSVEHGEKLLDWLIHPMTTAGFVKRYWEKRPFVAKRNKTSPQYYDWLLTTEKLDAIFRDNVLKYGENVDVTMYEDGKRVTVSNDMQGRVRPAVIWDLYSTGHSIRVLNPQTYCKPLWRLNSSLQEKFGCFVGANLYLTPPESQGFAPHYDDIEAFILQIEGKKRWQVYKPNESHNLARFSSQDFEEGADLGERIFDIVLEPGDIMYFPRGTIHQAKTEEGHHSMHITLSVYQQNTYGDLLKHHFSKCLDKLFASDIKSREGLPMDYLSFMGAANARNKDKEIVQKRNVFHTKLRSLMSKVFNMDADAAADEIGKKFIWDSLPPFLNRREKETTVEDDGEFMLNGKVRNRVEFDPDVEIKLIRKNCIRLIDEEGTLKLYFATENPLVYHKDEPNFMEITPELRLPIEHLVKSYPNYVKIEDLPLKNDDTKLNLVSELWENGILKTKQPLQPTEFDDDFDMDQAEDVDSEQSDDSNGTGSEEDLENASDIDSDGDEYDEIYLDDDSYADEFELSGDEELEGIDSDEYGLAGGEGASDDQSVESVDE